MALVALAVKLTSPGPVLYHQRRVGQHGRVFTVHKFRSMRQDAEAATGAVWASKDGDPRVTPIGGFLRRTRLDELPQLWNVLVGDMSLVGPRPERPEFVGDLTQADSVLRPAPHRAARPDRLGAGALHLRRDASKTRCRSCSTTSSTSSTCRSRSTSSSCSQTVKTVLLRKGA